MPLLYHNSLVTADVPRAAAFYDRVLATLGAERLVDELPLLVAYGMPGEEASFFIQSPDHMPFLERTTANAHFAFKATAPEEVVAFYDAALANGAESVLAAKVHEEIHPTYFGTVIRDLDGHMPECFVIVEAAD
ncbi:MAG: VOC family protein [Novosphingobium sp.]|nr:VOC family protein [Novosphingobium sp.]MBO9602282.1 VOC family protein [Novosphingobium sp.]